MQKILLYFFLFLNIIFQCEFTELTDGQKADIKTSAFAVAKVTAAFLSVPFPLTAVALGIGIEMLDPIISKIQDQGKDIWDQIEDRVVAKIGEKLSAKHVEELKNYLFELDVTVERMEKFNENDLKFIIRQMRRMVPLNPELGWHDDLPLTMVYYIPYLMEGYYKMINDGKEEICALGKSLLRYREFVVLGLKEMVRKRYQAIESKSTSQTDYDKPCREVSADERNNKKKERKSSKSSKRRISQNRLCVDFHLHYIDPVTKNEFKVTKRQNAALKSWDDVIEEKVLTPTIEYLEKHVVDPINEYFTDENCLVKHGCECPEPIKREEYSLRWPEACNGVSDDGEACLFPAGTFNVENLPFCYTSDFKAQRHVVSKAVDFRKCMPLNRKKVISG